MKKECITFFAVYGVIFQGFVLFALSLKEDSFQKELTVFLTGSFVLLVAFLIMKILKRIIHKHRPPKRIEFFTPFDRYAFPSGHATGLSVVTFFIFERDIVLGSVAIIISLCIMAARVRAHVHDYVDIVGGILLGVSVALLLSSKVEIFVFSQVIQYFN